MLGPASHLADPLSLDSFTRARTGYPLVVPKRIDVARAQRLITRGAQLVDVLPDSIFVQEHLPGALSLPLETLTPATASELDPVKAVVVYCFDQH